MATAAICNIWLDCRAGRRPGPRRRLVPLPFRRQPTATIRAATATASARPSSSSRRRPNTPATGRGQPVNRSARHLHFDWCQVDHGFSDIPFQRLPLRVRALAPPWTSATTRARTPLTRPHRPARSLTTALRPRPTAAAHPQANVDRSDRVPRLTRCYFKGSPPDHHSHHRRVRQGLPSFRLLLRHGPGLQHADSSATS